jgi:DNA polymerase III subunit delta
MPELDLQRLEKRIAQGKPIPAVVLLGTDSYLRDLCRAKLVEAFIPGGSREWAVARSSAAERGWEDIFQRAQTLPMLAPRQILILEDLEALDDVNEEAAAALVEAFRVYLDDPAPFTMLVLEGAALDERRKLFKMLSEKALLVELTVGSASVPALATAMAKELGADIDDNAAEFLAEILNGELGRIRVEIEKLSLYVGDRGRITMADVEALVVSAKKYSVWQLADMLATQRRDRAFTFLDSLLREGEAPPAIVGALAWMYRKLIEAQTLPAHTSSWQVARLLGMRPQTAELALLQARKIPRSKLLEGIVALAEADNRLKSGTVDQRAVMEFLVARLTAGTAPAA